MVDQTGFFKILLKTLSEIPHEIFIEMSTLIIKNLLKNSSILNYEMLHFDRDDNCHKGSVVWLISYKLYAIRIIENLRKNFGTLVLILLGSIHFLSKIIYWCKNCANANQVCKIKKK